MSGKNVVRGAGGRPSPDAGEELDRKIMDIATQAFLADGYAATSVDMIAKKVGCSKPTIYRRYPSKEELFKAVVHNRCRRLFEVAQDAELSSQEPMAALKELFAQFLDFCLERETLDAYRILVTDARRVPAVADSLSTEIMQPFFERIKMLLTRTLRWPDTKQNRERIQVLSRYIPGFVLQWPMHQALIRQNSVCDPKERRRNFLICWEMIEKMIQQADAPNTKKD
ncbi:TetR/AcrR family transcriptional regulator [Acetobacter pomorum]|uniref:TetR/AcrR family transcriptional regulator n=1 Tax=Acetobacter pomorum TaxID=65959 RepID=A0A2G4RGJ1_9PROT|nr:TetR/AcrR family transcriptional regulator [Acetobacter pomorum]PHY94825.1 TetR/AcrR family transcriptional regulator [Acetobacter pomorum]GBR47335.1 TetR family transcriptional regulator [Acetobacter pomorum DSM 11825]